MPSLVIVGAQWGDEGKGKLVDYLTSNADWVVRFHGGNNAGHTLVVNGVKTKLSVVPSGILRPQTKCLIGAGVVVNPQVLLSEFAELQRNGVSISPERVFIDREANVILPYHAALDQAREAALGDKKIGTTGRGIGPAYEDRAARTCIRIADFQDRSALRDKFMKNVEQKNLLLKNIFGSTTLIQAEEAWRELSAAADKLMPLIANGSLILDKALARDERVIFEGAQGTFLDTTFGTVPFVTSSSTLAGAATVGCGIGPKRIDYVLGVAKAYATRVGAGPFPTEDHGEKGALIRERGAEFGTVTGRPRRCGWFDAVSIKRAVRLNGIDSLALTKLDVLSGVGPIKVCVKYLLDGKELEDMPALVSELERVEPQYIELEGWEGDLTQIKKWHKLPAAARLYLSTISEIVGCSVTIASVGAERESTLFSSGASFVKNFVEVVAK
jgi:adenylosuccinate synthase